LEAPADRLYAKFQQSPRILPCSQHLDSETAEAGVSNLPTAALPFTLNSNSYQTMGWLKLGARFTTSSSPPFEGDLKYTTKHIENVSIGPESPGVKDSYPIVSLDTPDDNLPFIPPEEVKKRNSAENGGLCMSHILI
jgi:hypothetical protein